MSVTRKTRLSKSAEFDRVYRKGRSVQQRLLVLYRLERPEDTPVSEPLGSRIGLTVSKKIGGAVQRNRLKRQLREAFLACPYLEDQCDYVAIARPGLAKVADRDFSELQSIVDDLAKRAIPKKS